MWGILRHFSCNGQAHALLFAMTQHVSTFSHCSTVSSRGSILCTTRHVVYGLPPATLHVRSDISMQSDSLTLKQQKQPQLCYEAPTHHANGRPATSCWKMSSRCLKYVYVKSTDQAVHEGAQTHHVNLQVTLNSKDENSKRCLLGHLTSDWFFCHAHHPRPQSTKHRRNKDIKDCRV
jgi:hypothetical protein